MEYIGEIKIPIKYYVEFVNLFPKSDSDGFYIDEHATELVPEFYSDTHAHISVRCNRVGIDPKELLKTMAYYVEEYSIHHGKTS